MQTQHIQQREARAVSPEARLAFMDLDDEIDRLQNEAWRIGQPLLRAWASELVARVRVLQDAGTIDDRERNSCFARLCAVANGNRLTLFGLRRADNAPWAEVARCARARRDDIERLVAGAARGSLLRSPVKQPADPCHQTCSGGEPLARLELPHLAAAAKLGKLLVVGGRGRERTIHGLRERTGLPIEYVATMDEADAAVAPLLERIARGATTALVVINGFMRHRQFDPICAAARAAGVPLSYGGRGGIGALEGALKQLELMIAKAAPGSAA